MDLCLGCGFTGSSEPSEIMKERAGCARSKTRCGRLHAIDLRRSRAAGTRRGVAVSGTEIIQAGIGVVLFAAIEVVVWCGSNLGEAVAEAIVLAAIRQLADGAGQLAQAGTAIVLEVARSPPAAVLILADPLQPAGKRALNGCRPDRPCRLIEHLQAAGYIQIIDQPLGGGDAVESLRGAIAELVVNQVDHGAAAGHFDPVVLRVVVSSIPGLKQLSQSCQQELIFCPGTDTDAEVVFIQPLEIGTRPDHHSLLDNKPSP